MGLRNHMDLSIIIVNWNSVHFVRKCLKAIYENSLGMTVESIVVDNHSPEGGVDSLQAEFPEVLIVKSEENLGFAGANNLGFQNSSGQFLLFLNPDTEVLGAAIRTMLDQTRTISDAGVVGCKLLNTDGSVQISCVQTFPTILNQLLDIEVLQRRWPSCRLWNIAPLFTSNEKPVSVEVISGACMMMKRSVFEAAGMFSEEYFMYAEDLDLCYKVRQLGLRNYYIGTPNVIHHGGKSTSQQRVSRWSVVTKTNSVEKFCNKIHGPIYAGLYRYSMGAAAALRLGVIWFLCLYKSISAKGSNLDGSREKWLAILRWSVGLERTALQTNKVK